MNREEKITPQIQAIINFRNDIIKRTGQMVSMSEAIAGWIALGYAEHYRRKYLNPSN